MADTNQANQTGDAEQPKKISLAEAAKQKLAQKKLAQAEGKNQKHQATGNQMMKSQQTKKPSNTRRKMGT